MDRIAYPFQSHVADLLLSGKNVILQAPTGAGKTWAAELPFVEARAHELDFPRKCIYAVPMRVLANQFVAQYSDGPLQATIQTGEHALDRQFTGGDITFATIDQVLSSFLLSPYSLSRRQANLNAGAVASSYLVFDEFHLFDPDSMLPTTLEMLSVLRGVAPFLLMTATFSADMLAGLGKAMDAVVVPENDQDRQAMQDLPSQRKTRTYRVHDEPLSAETILACHRQRTLVVCNVVARAQALYRALRDHPAREGAHLLLLHSRFLPEDRARYEAEIRSAFGRGGGDGQSWIVVATQVVEVGLDITCDDLHTELAPANAIVQRAGRCARYEGETGCVHLYHRSWDNGGQEIDLAERCLPYQGMNTCCSHTLEQFRARQGQAMRFSDEQDLVTAVHGPDDRRLVEGLVATREAHRYTMNQVLRGEKGAYAGQLVRQIASQRIVVHHSLDAVRQRPFAFESFGLHMGVVRGLVKDWLERANDLALESMAVYALHDCGDPDESGRTLYDWLPVMDVKDIGGAPLVLVHPALATYDREIGFVPESGGNYIAESVPAAEQERELYGYRLESYQDHACLTHQASVRLWPAMQYAAVHLEEREGWERGTLRQASEVVAMLHDTAKLGRNWQKWVRKYQRAIGRPVPAGCYAHTDWDPTNGSHQAANRSQGRKPAHAVEGAVAVASFLWQQWERCEPVAKAMFTAIARHHGAFAGNFAAYELEQVAPEIAQRLLAGLPFACCPVELASSSDPVSTDIATMFSDPQYDGELLAYMLLVRVLRLADQEATSIGSGSAAKLRPAS